MPEPAFKERDVNKQHKTPIKILATQAITKILNILLSTTKTCRSTTSCTLSQ